MTAIDSLSPRSSLTHLEVRSLPVLGSAFRWAALARRKQYGRVYFSRPMRPRWVSWKEVGSLRP